ncbi:MAG: type I-E CRISPR-associated protein Cse1/CasA [Atopobiaceae bacterium]|nr:type I-E CRISPR-associated protein Cse1/CasA [Atopobiaceae bacterium]
MEDMQEATFNLVDEPWICAITTTGQMVELSLRELFTNATQLKALANDLPTQDFAILRMLVAIVQRATIELLYESEYPSQAWGDLWNGETLPLSEINEYLDLWRGRFNLLDEKQPFMQVAGMHATNGKVKDIRSLLGISENKPQLFPMRTLSGMESLSHAEAARWLLHIHAFDAAGIKSGVVGDANAKNGKSASTGLPGWAGGLGGVYLEGDTLAETLLLNLCPCADCRDNRDEFANLDDDLPVWERKPLTPGDEQRSPTGYADLYTWQSRRVLLKSHDGRIVGAVLTNGNKLAYQNQRAFEPMTAWRRSQAQEKKLKITPVYLPYQHQSGKSFWRGLTVVLPERSLSATDSYSAPGIVYWAGFLASTNGGCQLSKSYPIRLHATGFVYGTQNAVITDMIDDTLTLSAVLLSPEGADAADLAKRCMKDADSAVREFGSLAVNIKLASGLDHQLASAAREKAQAEAYYELDEPFRAWLYTLSSQLDKPLLRYEIAWHDTARSILLRLSRQLMDEADDKAIQGRKVKQGGREQWMSAGRAESLFLYGLGHALPRKQIDDTDSTEGK